MLLPERGADGSARSDLGDPGCLLLSGSVPGCSSMSVDETPLEAAESDPAEILGGAEDPEILRALERFYWERLEREIRDAQSRDREI